MLTDTTVTADLQSDLGTAAANLRNLISLLDPHSINRIPYPDSWTAGQLLRHVSKSTDAIAGAIRAEGKPAGRDAGKRIPELKKTFLDFGHKMKAPDFLVPEAGPYEKDAAIDALDLVFSALKSAAADADLAQLADGFPLGPVTKLELLHFVLYHTQRHTQQMKRICDALQLP